SFLCSCTGAHPALPSFPTRRSSDLHHRLAVERYSACSVSSGVRVATQPSRFEIRWTCVSTQMFCRLLNDRISTRFAEHLRRHARSEEHTSELQSRGHLVCRLLLEKK